MSFRWIVYPGSSGFVVLLCYSEGRYVGLSLVRTGAMSRLVFWREYILAIGGH